MKKRLAALFVALAIALVSPGLAAAPALAEEPAQTGDLPTTKIDVDADNGVYDGYTVDDDDIVLLKTDVVYELHGNSGRRIVAANSDTPVDQYFHLRLNGVYVGGGIGAQNGDTFCLCAEAADGTENNVEALNALKLYIVGGGSLDAETLDVGPAKASAPTVGESYLFVQDAEVEVKRGDDATKACAWMGSAVLAGDASVMYVSAGDYAALRVLNAGGSAAAVTLKDNARLFCLQADGDAPSETIVDGLLIKAGKLVLSDAAFLQAEARPCTNAPEDAGIAVVGGDGIEVKDSARIVASSYGSAIDSGGDMTVSGKGVDIQAQSKEGKGIAVGGKLIVKDGANIDAAGKLAAIDVYGSVDIEGAYLSIDSETAAALAGRSAISVFDTVVSASHAHGFAAFSAAESSPVDIAIGGCLLTLPEGGELGSTDINNSLVLLGSAGTVHGDYRPSCDLVLAPGVTLTVPAGASLTIPEGFKLEIQEGAALVVEEGAKLVNEGTVSAAGAVDNRGTIECSSHNGGTATCTSPAVCGLCHAEYGEPDPHNHANLVHVGAKAATATVEGSIEYWFCDACGKYFSDEAAEHEISKADTVAAKLSETPTAETAVVVEKTVSKKKGTGGRLAATGDSNAVVVAAVVAFGCACIAGAGIAHKRNSYI